MQGLHSHGRARRLHANSVQVLWLYPVGNSSYPDAENVEQKSMTDDETAADRSIGWGWIPVSKRRDRRVLASVRERRRALRELREEEKKVTGRYVAISKEDVTKILGDQEAEMLELAGIMYKKLARGVESPELVTLEFDLGRAKTVARRRGAALDYIGVMLEDLLHSDSATLDDIETILFNITAVQRFA